MATVLNAVVPLDVSVILVILNIPILPVGVILKGLRFTINTIFAFVLYVVLIALTEPLPALSGTPLVAAVFGGMLYGVGMACLVRGNGSIVTAVEKKQMLLFNSAASECRGGPQSGRAVDFIVSTGGYPYSGFAAA